MFNLIDDLSNLINLVERITLLSDLCFFNIQKLNEKSALFFFDNQVRHERFASKFRVFLTENYSPNWVLTSFNRSDRSIKSSFDVEKGLCVRIKKTNPRVEYFRSLPLVFINAQVPIAIKEASEPFPKFISWNGVGRNVEFTFSKERRIFKNRNLMADLISIFSPSKLRIFEVVLKQKKLWLFDDGILRNLIKKVNGWFSIGRNKPAPSFLSFFSLSFIDFSAKLFLKQEWNFFIGHFSSNGKVPILAKGNPAFCVKKSCKIFHSSPWFGKLHFTKYNDCPQRLNSMERGSILRYAIV